MGPREREWVIELLRRALAETSDAGLALQVAGLAFAEQPEPPAGWLPMVALSIDAYQRLEETKRLSEGERRALVRAIRRSERRRARRLYRVARTP